MVGKEHKNLLRDIEGYIKVIDQSSTLSSANFFIESSYKQAGNGKENKDVMKAIRKLNSEIDALKNELVEKSDGSKNSPIENRSNFTMKQDVYRITKKKGDKVIGMESRDTYRIYKDLLLMYVLGLNGSKYIEFKMKYISAFNYIEQQYMNYMAERIKIKDGFLKIYNDLRAENAKLLLNKGI